MESCIFVENYHMYKTLVIFLSALFLSCKSQAPRSVTGDWRSDSTHVKVRVKTCFLKYQFLDGKITASITIDADHKATGRVGTLSFQNVPLQLNEGNPNRTGVAYRLKLGNTTQLWNGAEEVPMEVELWFLNSQNGGLRAELRQSSTADNFPMGELLLVAQ